MCLRQQHQQWEAPDRVRGSRWNQPRPITTPASSRRADIVDTIIAWSDEILAWHHSDRASNGRIEGTNNLLQVLRRNAHGFTNPTNFEARGILVT